MSPRRSCLWYALVERQGVLVLVRHEAAVHGRPITRSRMVRIIAGASVAKASMKTTAKSRFSRYPAWSSPCTRSAPGRGAGPSSRSQRTTGAYGEFMNSSKRLGRRPTPSPGGFWHLQDSENVHFLSTAAKDGRSARVEPPWHCACATASRYAQSS
eukprot:2247539-Prymnesium_polylepis.1